MMLLYLLTELLGPTTFYDFAVSFDDELSVCLFKLELYHRALPPLLLFRPLSSIWSLDLLVCQIAHYSKCLLNHRIFPLSHRRYVGPILAHIPRRTNVVLHNFSSFVWCKVI